jgi:predicted adenine nucleotide alpha hydrolase (AANH) superfamily ATPase
MGQPVETEKKKLLLVTCCAPCSPHIIDMLKEQFAVSIYFYNPNIHPHHEYNVRMIEMHNHALYEQLPFIEGEYDADRWFDMTKGLEQEPERGARCEVCFRMRLNHACLYAQEHGFDAFATTYAISPHKDTDSIYGICRNLAHDYGLTFLDFDFRKGGGFQKSLTLSKTFNFYRQSYCGCEYSRRETMQKKSAVSHTAGSSH